jgi:hypothetical protein
MTRQKMEKDYLDEMAFTKLVLSMSRGAVVENLLFRIVKSCQTNEHEDRNDALVWEKQKKKLNAVYSPSLFKIHRMFSESKLSEDEYLKIGITTYV